MSKLVFAVVVLLAGLELIQAQRQAEIIAAAAKGRGDAAQYLTKWDGRLPQYTFGGNAVPFVQLPAGGGTADGGRR